MRACKQNACGIYYIEEGGRLLNDITKKKKVVPAIIENSLTHFYTTLTEPEAAIKLSPHCDWWFLTRAYSLAFE